MEQVGFPDRDGKHTGCVSLWRVRGTDLGTDLDAGMSVDTNTVSSDEGGLGTVCCCSVAGANCVPSSAWSLDPEGKLSLRSPVERWDALISYRYSEPECATGMRYRIFSPAVERAAYWTGASGVCTRTRGYCCVVLLVGVPAAVLSSVGEGLRVEPAEVSVAAELLDWERRDEWLSARRALCDGLREHMASRRLAGGLCWTGRSPQAALEDRGPPVVWVDLGRHDAFAKYARQCGLVVRVSSKIPRGEVAPTTIGCSPRRDDLTY